MKPRQPAGLTRATYLMRELKSSGGVPILTAGWDQRIKDLSNATTDPKKIDKLALWDFVQYCTDSAGKLRSDWSVSTTGRISSGKPPLQGIPRKLRTQVGERGKAILTLDLSTCHLVLAANLAGDPVLLEDVSKKDVFGEVASRISAEATAKGQTPMSREEGKLSVLIYLNGGSDNVHQQVKDLFGSNGAYRLTGDWIRTQQRVAAAKGEVVCRSQKILVNQNDPHTATGKCFQQIEFDIMSAATAHLLESPVGQKVDLVLFLHDELILGLPAGSVEELETVLAEAVKTFATGIKNASVSEGMRELRIKAQVGSTWGGAESLSDHPKEAPDGGESPRKIFLKRIVEESSRLAFATRSQMAKMAKDIFVNKTAVSATSTEQDHAFARACLVVQAMDEPSEFSLCEAEASPAMRKIAKALRAVAKEALKKKDRIAKEVEKPEDETPPMFLVGNDCEITNALESLYKNQYGDLVFDALSGLHGTDGQTGFWKHIHPSAISRKIQEWDHSPIGDGGKILQVRDSTISSATSMLMDRATRSGEDENFFQKVPEGLVLSDGHILDPGSTEPRKITPADRVREGEGIQIEYSTDAECPKFHKFFEEIYEGAEDAALRKQFMLEWMGATILGKTIRYGKSPILYGRRGSGKGVLLEVLRWFLPPTQWTELDLKDLCGKDAANYTAEIYGKKLITCSDMKKGWVSDTSVFKKAAMGEPLTARGAYKKTITFRANAAWVMATEDPPSMAGAEDGIWRRLVIIAHEQAFVDDLSTVEQHPDMPSSKLKLKNPNLLDELVEEKQGILRLCLESFQNLVKRGSYVLPTSSTESLKTLAEVGDPVAAYHSKYCIPGADGEWPPVVTVKASVLYDHYRADYEAGGGKNLMSQGKFAQRWSCLEPTSAVGNKRFSDNTKAAARMMPHRWLQDMISPFESAAAKTGLSLDATASEIRGILHNPTSVAQIRGAKGEEIGDFMVHTISMMAEQVQSGHMATALTTAQLVEMVLQVDLEALVIDHGGKRLLPSEAIQNLIDLKIRATVMPKSSDLDALEMMN